MSICFTHVNLISSLIFIFVVGDLFYGIATEIINSLTTRNHTFYTLSSGKILFCFPGLRLNFKTIYIKEAKLIYMGTTINLLILWKKYMMNEIKYKGFLLLAKVSIIVSAIFVKLSKLFKAYINNFKF